MFYKDDPIDGAVLTFANTHREAKKISFGEINLDEWCLMRGHRLKDDFIFDLGDQEKIKNGTPHVIDDPITCKKCELWGKSKLVDGICTFCLTNDLNILK